MPSVRIKFLIETADSYHGAVGKKVIDFNASFGQVIESHQNVSDDINIQGSDSEDIADVDEGILQ